MELSAAKSDLFSTLFSEGKKVLQRDEPSLLSDVAHASLDLESSALALKLGLWNSPNETGAVAVDQLLLKGAHASSALIVMSTMLVSNAPSTYCQIGDEEVHPAEKGTTTEANAFAPRRRAEHIGPLPRSIESRPFA